MMTNRICKKCGGPVPKSVWVDGKKRNCQRRKYCLSCSPFGEHNTKKLEKKHAKLKKCPDCSKQHDKSSKRCFACYFQHKKKKRHEQVETLMGGFACWFCGYKTCKRNIHFHHVHEEEKLFGLSSRELMYNWKAILKELQKCVVVCANCHGEIHENIIEYKRVQSVYSKKWVEIRSRSSIG